MGLFMCSRCESVDNTALGLYWMRNKPELFLWDENNIQFKGEPLCSECAPKKFSNGKLSGYGQWHGKFSKDHISTIPESERSEIYNTKEYEGKH